jgi:hypothetical protein
MGYTIESIIIFPISVIILLNLITSTANLYERVRFESSLESKAIFYSTESADLFSEVLLENPDHRYQTYSIAVNPVKIKENIEILIDNGNIIASEIPFIKTLKEQIFNVKTP